MQLRDVEPAVNRLIDVPAKSTLPELPDLLQAAIGWTNSHLQQFVTPVATYGIDTPGGDVWPEDQRDEVGVQLPDLGNRFEYLFDLGDGWTHDVEVVGPGGDAQEVWTATVPARPKTAAGRAGTPYFSPRSPTSATPTTMRCEAGSTIGCARSTWPPPICGYDEWPARSPKVSGF